jgi:methylated-DNA-[protein]-cysteine S-methyltransferase
MTTTGFALFDTALGQCAIAWGERGIRGMQLPERSAAQTAARMRQRFPGAQEDAAPAEVQRVIDGIAGLLAGQAMDLGAVAIDEADIAEFDRRVHAITRGIARGETLSYGEIASRLGDPALARAVGQALARNPFAVIVPCHRVLAADGRIGGFSAGGGAVTKQRLLLIEGARVNKLPGLFDDLPDA